MNDLSPKEFILGGVEISAIENMDFALKTIIRPNNTVVPGFGVSINSEIIVSAINDPSFKQALATATFRFPDGIGVVWAMRRHGAKTVRIPGCELWESLMICAGKSKSRVYLLGATSEVLELTTSKLKLDFGVNFVGCNNGYFPMQDHSMIIRSIVASNPQIVTVAMGSPRQEEFIVQCRKEHPDAFYLGVGGTYDVFVNAVKRAPEWIRDCNCEWLYRLIKNPKRVFRQMNLVKFVTKECLGQL